jgi:hypothetical protein
MRLQVIEQSRPAPVRTSVELATVRFIDANLPQLQVAAGVVVALSSVAIIATLIVRAF